MSGNKNRKKQNGYTIAPFPRERQLVIDTSRLRKRKHSIHGLVEVDVTNIRQYLREHKTRTGERLSFTAYILFCLGHAVEENKAVHAYRNWRGQLVLFDDVDVTTIIEVNLEDQTFPLAHIVRGTNKRSFRDIHEEIRAVQNNPQQSPSGQRWKWAKMFAVLLSFLRIAGQTCIQIGEIQRLDYRNVFSSIFSALRLDEGRTWVRKGAPP